MERSNDFNNQIMQTEEYIICINDETKVNKVTKEEKIHACKLREVECQESLMKRKLNKFCYSCILKEKNGVFVLEMHFVGFFMLMMI
jgi:hypothetical protein